MKLNYKVRTHVLDIIYDCKVGISFKAISGNHDHVLDQQSTLKANSSSIFYQSSVITKSGIKKIEMVSLLKVELIRHLLS